jgi:hypothetical protein
MSYTHIHLPKINVLKQMLSETPEKINYYMKYGALLGSTESINYLTKKIDEYTTKRTY